jgi:hypothetical protein
VGSLIGAAVAVTALRAPDAAPVAMTESDVRDEREPARALAA